MRHGGSNPMGANPTVAHAALSRMLSNPSRLITSHMLPNLANAWSMTMALMEASNIAVVSWVGDCRVYHEIETWIIKSLIWITNVKTSWTKKITKATWVSRWKWMVLTVTVDKLPVRISRTKEGVEWIIFNNLVICYPLSSDGKSEGEGSLDEKRISY